MANCGATASFIDSSFAQLHGLKFSPLQHPQDLTVADSRTIYSGSITHTVRIAFALGATHREVLELFVTILGQYPVVLGLPWLRKHDPRIHFKHNTVTFDSKHCLEHCITTHQAMTIHGVDYVFDTLHKHETPQTPQEIPHETTQTHEIHEIRHTHETPQETHKTTPKTYKTRRSTAPKPRYSPCSSHRIDMADCTRKMNRELTLLDNPIVTKPIVTKYTGAAKKPIKYCIAGAARQLTEHITGKAKNPTKDITSAASKTMNISMIGAAPFNHFVQKSQQNPKIQIFSVTLRDINIALAPKHHTNPVTRLSTEYHEFLDVFSRKDADILSKHRPGYDYTIELMESKAPTWGPLYSLSTNELKMLKAYIEKMVNKGFIQASSLSAASPVFFAKKPSGGLQFCVDYRALNAITIKNCYFLPLVKETLERVCKAKIFSKIDIIAAFNKLRIKEGEEWKTTFRTQYGLYKYLVMSFGLANGPFSFQNYINNILHGMLDVFCTAYIDDILIYSNSKKEHQEYVHRVLAALQKAGLQADIDKCEFHVTEVNYLGLLIMNNGICLDPHKVSAVQQ